MAFWRLYDHSVWATKNREPRLRPQVEERLYGYIVCKAAELGVCVHAVDGWLDHVHLIVSIPPAASVAGVLRLVLQATQRNAIRRIAAGSRGGTTEAAKRFVAC